MWNTQGKFFIFKEFFIFQKYLNDFFLKVIDYSLKIFLATIIWYFSKSLVRIMGRFLFETLEKSKLEKRLEATVLNFLKSLFKVLTDIIIVTIILSYFGVPITSLVAVLGSIGLAIGLSVQNILSNFVSGFIVLNFRFFKRGDHIKCSDIEGVVEDVQIFFTTLKAFDGELFKIPNSKLTSDIVVNFSSSSKRRVVFPFQMPFNIDIDLLKNKIKSLVTLESEDCNAKIDAFDIIITKYTTYYMVGQVRFFVDNKYFWHFKYFVGENIRKILLNMEVNFPIHFVDLKNLYK